jgi:hypothetical protein
MGGKVHKKTKKRAHATIIKKNVTNRKIDKSKYLYYVSKSGGVEQKRGGTKANATSLFTFKRIGITPDFKKFFYSINDHGDLVGYIKKHKTSGTKHRKRRRRH